MIVGAEDAWTGEHRVSSSALGKGHCKFNIGVSIAFAVGLFASTCVSTHAQTAAETSATPPQQAAPALDSAATAQPAAGEQPQIRSTRFDDWYYRCVDVKAADGKTVAQCEVAQVSQVRQGDSDVNVLTLAIARTAGDPAKQGDEAKPGLLLTALVPLNVFLPAGFAIGADGKPAIESSYRNCNQAGCWAQQRLTLKTVDALKTAGNGEGRIRLMNGQNVNVRFSLKGLTAALNELQKSGS